MRQVDVVKHYRRVVKGLTALEARVVWEKLECLKF
jgi:hypothetical protein